MELNDRAAIDDLLGKLAAVEREASPLDGQADAFIAERLAKQAKAPYQLAQAIIVPQYALNEALARTERLKAELAQRPAAGGLLGRLFGGAAPARPAAPARRQEVPASMRAAPQCRGFHVGVAQTPMGVVGSMLLANAIGGMFGADETMAAEESDPVAQGGGFDDSGFDEEF